jgi:plasmid stabilization system protein ParE
MRVEFHRLAIADARQARRWYARRSATLANLFLARLGDAVAQIAAAPQQWPAYLHGTRVFRLRRFPYLVIYQEQPSAVRVIAVAHGGRKPGYWRRRLP